MVRVGNRTKLANESVPEFFLELIEKDVLPTAVANLSGYKLRAASGHLATSCSLPKGGHTEESMARLNFY